MNKWIFKYSYCVYMNLVNLPPPQSFERHPEPWLLTLFYVVKLGFWALNHDYWLKIQRNNYFFLPKKSGHPFQTLFLKKCEGGFLGILDGNSFFWYIFSTHLNLLILKILQNLKNRKLIKFFNHLVQHYLSKYKKYRL